MRPGTLRPSAVLLIIASSLAAAGFPLFAGSEPKTDTPLTSSGQASQRTALRATLSPEEWARLEQSVDRALAWVSSQQQPDGAFPSAASGQPAITSLCILAFLSRGHQPGVGPYGDPLNRAIDFVLNSQQPDGLLNYAPVEATHVHMGASHTATYNHAIAGLMLTEVFGSVKGSRAKQVKLTIERALKLTRQMQREPKKEDPVDEGGWRYVRKFYGSDSDLSVTAWHLMFLRSAKNAEFVVPDQLINSAMAYVERCFDETTGLFYYGLRGDDRYVSRAMMGAGVLCLSLGGKPGTQVAQRAGDWVLANPFTVYGATVGGRGDRFHYSAYYCSQAMLQLGGHYWKDFFPPLVKTFLQHQSSDGSWPPEAGEDEMFGAAYTTALAVLTLTPPFQLLPIYQR